MMMGDKYCLIVVRSVLTWLLRRIPSNCSHRYVMTPRDAHLANDVHQ